MVITMTDAKKNLDKYIYLLEIKQENKIIITKYGKPIVVIVLEKDSK